MSRSNNPGTKWSPSFSLLLKNWMRREPPLNKHFRVGVKSGTIYFTCIPEKGHVGPEKGILIGRMANDDSASIMIGIRQWDGEGFPTFPDSVVFKAEDPEFFPKLRSQLILWHNKLVHPSSCPPLG